MRLLVRVAVVAVLYFTLLAALPSVANMPAYGPPSMTGTLGNKLLWQMKREDPNFRGYAFRVALAQRGDRYVWGAAGPNHFDCSGLTMYAYRLAGRRIPHSSTAQRLSTYGISLASAHPGDLLFYNGHVEMYAGKIGSIRYAVAAHRPGVPVKLAPMRYSGLLKVGRVR